MVHDRFDRRLSREENFVRRVFSMQFEQSRLFVTYYSFILKLSVALEKIKVASSQRGAARAAGLVPSEVVKTILCHDQFTFSGIKVIKGVVLVCLLASKKIMQFQLLWWARSVRMIEEWAAFDSIPPLDHFICFDFNFLSSLICVVVELAQ